MEEFRNLVRLIESGVSLGVLGPAIASARAALHAALTEATPVDCAELLGLVSRLGKYLQPRGSDDLPE
jgi:hypothetical protein